MDPPKKRDWFKKWLPSFFSPTGEQRPPRPSESGGFITHAQGFALHSPTMTAVHGNQYTTYVQGDRNIVPHIMGLLSQHIIRGAAHDSSARTPPPRCHPGTRVKLLARITAWFEGQGPQEILLWITGPAGVGKSALVQTFSEYLVKYDCLGASVFISRPNKRNNPHGIFTTIAYQLATRIEAYRNFIVERLSLDPELLSGDMEAQFATFIVEPFVARRIGEGGKRWCILLDGLDELRGEDAQRNIIQLISNFVLEHPDTPLVWIIASRPEFHISDLFEDDEVRASHWTEYIPIDSTEACEDVERFLHSSFKTMQKQFRRSVPRDWPSDTDFLKLTAASSGLFIYAQVVTQFIRDSAHADPASRFEVLLSVIDRSDAIPTEENPFVHLDALYNEILSSIPSTLWPTAKRLLACTIYAGDTFVEEYFNSLRGMSILFGIPRHVIYACLNKCRSTLAIPDWKVAHKQTLTFHHASFSDYLKDLRRSGQFRVGRARNIRADFSLSALEIWNECSGDDVAASSVETQWHQYCSQLDDKAPSRAIVNFHTKTFRSMVKLIMQHINESRADSLTYPQLCKVHMIKLYPYIDPSNLPYFICQLTRLSSEIKRTGIFREIQLRDLKFGHLDSKETIPAHVHFGRSGKFSRGKGWVLHRPRSDAELKLFVSELESFQEHSPELSILILGCVPKGRVAAFRCRLKNVCSCPEDYVYYVIPYLE